MANKHPERDDDACEHPAEFLHREPRIGKEPYIICDRCHAIVSGRADDPFIASKRPR